MKYPKEYLDEIKTRLKVSTVVSKSVALKKRGKEYDTTVETLSLVLISSRYSFGYFINYLIIP